MTDQPGREPEQRLPVPRPPSTPAPAERFSAPPAAHSFELTPERAASIVRQSASARFVGFLAVCVVVLFVILYYFYELGFPAGLTESRLNKEVDAQAVTSIERGYNLFEANCARCHGVNGEGGIGPVLNDNAKLYVHLSDDYVRNVLTVGGRYVCGNAKSLMPIWSNQNGGPLNYEQIENLIAFIRAPKGPTYVVRDPSLFEPIVGPDGKEKTFTGWRDPNFKPAPDATPVPDCWTDAFKSPTPSGSAAAGGSPGASASTAPQGSTSPSGSPAASGGGGSATLDLVAQGVAFQQTTLTAPAGPFKINFDNQDTGVQHNVRILDSSGKVLFDGGAPITGPAKTTYDVPALPAGSYKFDCVVHPTTMVGDLTVQ